MSETEDRVKSLLEEIMGLPDGWDIMDGLLQSRDLRDSLVEVRKNRGITQADVAERMGVGQPWISEFETQNWPDPRLSTIRRYAVSVGALVRHGIMTVAVADDEGEKESE